MKTTTRKRIARNDEPARVESVAEFLNRGGKIKKCPPKNAADSITGALSIDNEFVVTAMGCPEYIPNYVVSAETYDTAQEDQPDVLIASVCRESEIQAMPSELAHRANARYADSDEWSGDELLTDYFDEVEPEE
jgi:hypothetical protein